MAMTRPVTSSEIGVCVCACLYVPLAPFLGGSFGPKEEKYLAPPPPPPPPCKHPRGACTPTPPPWVHSTLPSIFLHKEEKRRPPPPATCSDASSLTPPPNPPQKIIRNVRQVSSCQHAREDSGCLLDFGGDREEYVGRKLGAIFPDL